MKTLKLALQKPFYLTITLLLVTAAPIYPLTASATNAFNQVNLVTDDQTVNSAQITDSSLKNAWGISYSPTGPFWVSANGTGVSTLYSVNPLTNATSKSGLTVSIPGNGNVTGQVFNSNPGAFNGNNFLFVSEDGTISGWRGALGTAAETLVSGGIGNIYKGVTEAQVNGHNYLYAANFATGAIDVLKGDAGAASLGGFTDPALPSGYAPFNIQNLNDLLFVTYALQTPGSGDETAGPGLGFVNVFDTQGNFIERLASEGTLNAPWGLAIAPASFGALAGDLLVGNFGDGRINAYDLTTGNFVEQLTGSNGQPLSIDGLWALFIGNGVNAGSAQSLYFSAGPNGETHGLFGTIATVPVPAATWLFGSALLGMMGAGRLKFRISG